MTSIICRRSGLKGASVMACVPEVGLKHADPHTGPTYLVTALPIVPASSLRAALYRESGLVL